MRRGTRKILGGFLIFLAVCAVAALIGVEDLYNRVCLAATAVIFGVAGLLLWKTRGDEKADGAPEAESMRPVAISLRKIIGWFCIFVAVCMLILTIFVWRDAEVTFGVTGVIFYGAIGLFLVMKKSKTPEEKADGAPEAESMRPYQVVILLRKIFGGLCLATAVLMAAMSAFGGTEITAEDAVGLIICAVFGLFLVMKKSKTPEEKAERKAKLEALKAEIKVEKERKKEIESRTVFTEHTAGLPLGEGISCSVRFDEKCVTIDSSGVSFHIAYKKMTDMRVTTSTEIKKYYVSDVGGAIAGNAAFGPLGALLFGGAQERTDTEVKRFLMFTYINANTGKLDYAAFQIPRKLDQMKAKELIGKYRFKAASGGMSIEL